MLRANGSSFALSAVLWDALKGRRSIERDRSFGMLSSTPGSSPVPRRVRLSVFTGKLLETSFQHSILPLESYIEENEVRQVQQVRGTTSVVNRVSQLHEKDEPAISGYHNS